MYIIELLFKYPPLIVNVPLTSDEPPKSTAPIISTSLKTTVPETVPAPLNVTLPVPPVKVELFVIVPLSATKSCPPD